MNYERSRQSITEKLTEDVRIVLVARVHAHQDFQETDRNNIKQS